MEEVRLISWLMKRMLVWKELWKKLRGLYKDIKMLLSNITHHLQVLYKKHNRNQKQALVKKINKVYQKVC